MYRRLEIWRTVLTIVPLQFCLLSSSCVGLTRKNIVERISMIAIPMVAYMEELALYVGITIMCILCFMTILIGWCEHIFATVYLYCWIYWESICQTDIDDCSSSMTVKLQFMSEWWYMCGEFTVSVQNLQCHYFVVGWYQ